MDDKSFGVLIGTFAVLCCLVPLLLVSGGVGLLTSIGLGSWALIFISLAVLGIGTYLFIKKSEEKEVNKMAECAHCGMEIKGTPVIFGGKEYCCEACAQADQDQEDRDCC